MKLNTQSKLCRSNILSKILILLLYIYFSSNQEGKYIIYLKTDGIINEMKILNESNFTIYQNSIFESEENNIYKQEINSKYGNKIIINISKRENSSKISVGFLLQINNEFYDLDNSNLTILFNKELISDEKTTKYTNETFQKDILYCFLYNTNYTDEINYIIISIEIPYNKQYNNTNKKIQCYESCSVCEEEGNETNHNCIKCNNSKEF